MSYFCQSFCLLYITTIFRKALFLPLKHLTIAELIQSLPESGSFYHRDTRRPCRTKVCQRTRFAGNRLRIGWKLPNRFAEDSREGVCGLKCFHPSNNQTVHLSLTARCILLRSIFIIPPLSTISRQTFSSTFN